MQEIQNLFPTLRPRPWVIPEIQWKLSQWKKYNNNAYRSCMGVLWELVFARSSEPQNKLIFMTISPLKFTFWNMPGQYVCSIYMIVVQKKKIWQLHNICYFFPINFIYSKDIFLSKRYILIYKMHWTIIVLF